jgi:CRISPR-associated protein GSU0054/csb2, Dpsyc system
MTCIVRFRFLRMSFHGLVEKGVSQWPPSPVRVLGALKSGAHALTDSIHKENAFDALAKITKAPPPIIHAPQHTALNIPPTYTDRTGLPEKLGSSSEEKPGRYHSLDLFGINSKNRELKPQDAVALAGNTLDFVIDVNLNESQLESLTEAAKLVPYFGRSNDTATVEILGPESSWEPPAYSKTWFPSKFSSGKWRGWQQNTLTWMDANFERVFSSDPSVNQLPIIDSGPHVCPLHYSELPIPDATTRLHVEALAKPRNQWQIPSLMGRINKQLPNEWSAIPLTISGHKHANGKVAGVGLIPPKGTDFANPPLEEFYEALGDDLGGPRPIKTLDPATWSGPARKWRSATPLRAFPNEVVVAHSIAEEYGQSFISIDASKQPIESDQFMWANSTYTDGFGQWWVTIEFEEPQNGPLVLGASKEDGFGVFLPVRNERR